LNALIGRLLGPWLIAVRFILTSWSWPSHWLSLVVAAWEVGTVGSCLGRLFSRQLHTLQRQQVVPC
jgi:hypothetical protein